MVGDVKPPSESGPEDRLQKALTAIDSANGADPNPFVVDGIGHPKELVHAQLMTAWVRALDPDADDAQLIAARAHHLRRWEVPRSSYPDGRAGYLRWRTMQRRRHADLVAEILVDVGYDPPVVERVQAIVGKVGLGRDAAVQTHEDALCLVFLETQLDDLIHRLGPAATADVVRKSLAKMSSRAIERAGELDLSDEGRAVLAEATSSSPEVTAPGSAVPYAGAPTDPDPR